MSSNSSFSTLQCLLFFISLWKCFHVTALFDTLINSAFALLLFSHLCRHFVSKCNVAQHSYFILCLFKTATQLPPSSPLFSSLSCLPRGYSIHTFFYVQVTTNQCHSTFISHLFISHLNYFLLKAILKIRARSPRGKRTMARLGGREIRDWKRDSRTIEA